MSARRKNIPLDFSSAGLSALIGLYCLVVPAAGIAQTATKKLDWVGKTHSDDKGSTEYAIPASEIGQVGVPFKPDATDTTAAPEVSPLLTIAKNAAPTDFKAPTTMAASAPSLVAPKLVFEPKVVSEPKALIVPSQAQTAQGPRLYSLHRQYGLKPDIYSSDRPQPESEKPAIAKNALPSAPDAP
jgi:hypothetical protein